VGEDRGCLYLMMPADLVERGVEACRWGRGGRGGGGGRERERARARALFGAIHNGGSRAPAHGFRITTLRPVSSHTLDGVAANMAKTLPGL
jgi:hypothetical protein